MQSNLEHIQKKVRFYKAMKKAYEEGASFPCYDEV